MRSQTQVRSAHSLERPVLLLHEGADVRTLLAERKLLVEGDLAAYVVGSSSGSSTIYHTAVSTIRTNVDEPQIVGLSPRAVRLFGEWSDRGDGVRWNTGQGFERLFFVLERTRDGLIDGYTIRPDYRRRFIYGNSVVDLPEGDPKMRMCIHRNHVRFTYPANGFWYEAHASGNGCIVHHSTHLYVPHETLFSFRWHGMDAWVIADPDGSLFVQNPGTQAASCLPVRWVIESVTPSPSETFACFLARYPGAHEEDLGAILWDQHVLLRRYIKDATVMGWNPSGTMPLVDARVRELGAQSTAQILVTPREQLPMSHGETAREAVIGQDGRIAAYIVDSRNECVLATPDGHELDAGNHIWNLSLDRDGTLCWNSAEGRSIFARSRPCPTRRVYFN